MVGGGVVVEAVRKRFGRGRWVLDGVDQVIDRESVTVVVGANGSGKSTLLRVVAGLSRPSAGRVVGRPSTVAFAPERLPARLRLSGCHYVAHMGRLRGLDAGAANRRATELFDRLELEPGPDVAIRTLSKGNSQKVALVQAFLAPVDLLILDEPFSGLDAAARHAVSGLIAERRAAGAAVLISSHVMVGAVGAGRILELRQGRLHPVAAGVESSVRIELTGGERASTVWFEGNSEVRVERPATGRRGLALLVDRSIADAVLARALADGWSVISVNPLPPPGGW